MGRDQSPGPNASMVLNDQLGVHATSLSRSPRLNSTAVIPFMTGMPSAFARASARNVFDRTFTQPPKRGLIVGAPNPKYGASITHPVNRPPAEPRESRNTNPPP